MTTQLLLGGVDDLRRSGGQALRDRAAFQVRMGNGYTIDDLLRDLEDVIEETTTEGMIKLDCGIADVSRGAGVKCADKEHGEDCHACQKHEAGMALDCGIGDKARRSQKACESGFDDDCAECRILGEEERRDCRMSSADRIAGKPCLAPDVDACSACAEYKASAWHTNALTEAHRNAAEVSAEQATDARVAALEADLAKALLRLNCGLVDRGGPSLSRCLLARDVGLGDVCGECMIEGIGRSVVREKAARKQTEMSLATATQETNEAEQRATEARTLADAANIRAEEAEYTLAFVRAERDRFSLELQRMPKVAATPAKDSAEPAKSAPKGHAVLPGQLKMFGDPPIAPARIEPVAPPPQPSVGLLARPHKLAATRPGCTGGCGPRGPHIKDKCGLAKPRKPGVAKAPT